MRGPIGEWQSGPVPSPRCGEKVRMRGDGRHRAMVLERAAPRLGPLRRRARASPPAGHAPAARRRLRRLPHGPSAVRRRSGDARDPDRPRPPDRRTYVEAVGAEVAGWRVGDRAGVAWLAGTDGTCDKCRSGPREPVRARDVHRLGRRRRLRDARDRARGLRAADPRRLRRPRGGAAAVRRRDRLPVAQAQRHRAGRPPRPLRLRRVGPDQRCRSRGTGAAACSSRPAPRPNASARCRWAPSGRAATTTGRPSRSTRAITFAPSGDVVRAALRATDRGATVAINAIHLDRLPEMPYEELWWERRLASVANFTRADAARVPGLAAQHPGSHGVRDAPARGRERRARPPVSRRGRRRRRSWCLSRPDARGGSGRRSPGRSRSPKRRGRGRWCWSSRSRPCRRSRSRRGRGPSPASRSPGTGCAGCP